MGQIICVNSAQAQVKDGLVQLLGDNGSLYGGGQSRGRMGFKEVLQEAAAIGTVGRGPLVP